MSEVLSRFDFPPKPHRTHARARRYFDQQANEALNGRVPTGVEVAQLVEARQRYVIAAVDLYAKTIQPAKDRAKRQRRRSS